MKTNSIVLSMLMSATLSTQLSADIIVSNFDTGADSWTITRNGASSTPDFAPTGGSPGGAISDIDALSGQAWFFNAPAKFTGDQSRHFNHSFTFDIRQEQISSGSQFGANDILLEGNGLELRLDIGNDGASGNPTIGQWTNYQFFFNELEGWTHAGSGLAADNVDLQTVLAGVNVLSIRGEFLSGSIGGDQAFLDNVILGQTTAVPEPSSLLCILTMGIGIFARRQGSRSRR